MSKIALKLDDTSDLPGLAREALGIHLKKAITAKFDWIKEKMPKS